MTERFALRFAWRFAQARLVHQRRLMPPNASYTALLARLAATRARAARTSSAKPASAFILSAIKRCASGRSPSLSACAHKQTTDTGAAHEASVNIVRSREERAERLLGSLKSAWQLGDGNRGGSRRLELAAAIPPGGHPLHQPLTQPSLQRGGQMA